jgi:hypothetical protein
MLGGMARGTGVEGAVSQLREVLPDGWKASVARRDRSGSSIRIVSPDGATAELEVTSLKDASPRSVALLDASNGLTLVVADWLSDRSRALLRERGASYVDATGNAEVRLSEPGLFVRTEGARRNPSPPPTKGPSLRGPKAWALQRTLAEVPPPIGVRELAQSVDVDPGYVSRALRVLEDELLIARTPRGPVTEVDWEGVLRRAATTYGLFDANETSPWVAPGGPDRFLTDLAAKRAGRWAITGSFAASRLAPVAAPEVAIVYADDPERVVRAGRLLGATRGTNVILAEPYEPIVWERLVTSGGATYVSTAQAALDCLTGNARMPAEGEAVLAWMRKNEPRWRNGTLGPRSKPKGT